MCPVVAGRDVAPVPFTEPFVGVTPVLLVADGVVVAADRFTICPQLYSN